MFRFHHSIPAALAIAILALGAGNIHAAEAKGTITTLRAERNEIVLTESFKDKTFRVDNTTKVLIDGHASRLVDLREGDQATVSYDRVGQVLIAGLVRVTRSPQQVHSPPVVTLPWWQMSSAVALYK